MTKHGVETRELMKQFKIGLQLLNSDFHLSVDKWLTNNTRKQGKIDAQMINWSFSYMSYLKERDKAKNRNNRNSTTYTFSIAVLKYITLRSTY